MDQGDELFRSPKIRNFFSRFDYEVLPTSPDSSNHNGFVERAHSNVSQGIKKLLIGASLDVKFWPYAFMHVLCICNALPRQGQDASTLFLSASTQS